MVGVFYLLARLGSMHFDRRTAGRAVFVLAVMPTSFFFNSIYSESLFLMFVLASLLFAYEKKWLLAGLAGALAAGTRNLGLGLALILFIEAFRAYGRPSRAMLASAIVPLGLIGLMAYHYFVLSDPLAFLKAQQYWEREFQWPWMGLINGYKELLDNLSPRAPFSVLRNFLNALLATMCIACLVAAAVRPRLRVPLSWQLLCWMFLLAPLFSGTDRAALYSIDRFVLVIPVTYYMLALLPNYVFRPWLVISAALLVFSTMGFCTWHFIG